jgi:flagellar motor switch protein FliN/FliY
MPAAQNSLEWIAGEISDRLAQVITSMAESPCSASWQTPSAVEPGLEWASFSVSGAAAGAVWLGASKEASAQVGRHLLAAAGVEDDDPEIQHTTFLEVLSQTLSAVGQAMSARVSKPVECGPAVACAAPAASATFTVQLSGCGEPAVRIFGAVSDPVLNLLAAPEEPQQPTAASTTENLPVPSGVPPALQLLMDVELPVSVSFGRAQLQIKDVVKLASGSILELNRGVSEPVEVIVNNCVIARGEVVVVEGNYGVRIDEIISPDERLRTLR